MNHQNILKIVQQFIKIKQYNNKDYFHGILNRKSILWRKEIDEYVENIFVYSEIEPGNCYSQTHKSIISAVDDLLSIEEVINYNGLEISVNIQSKDLKRNVKITISDYLSIKNACHEISSIKNACHEIPTIICENVNLDYALALINKENRNDLGMLLDYLREQYPDVESILINNQINSNKEKT